jgi:hypothetical protein
MKHLRWAGVRVPLLLLPLPFLALGGCSAPVFSIVDKKTCKGVDGSGKPQDETAAFAPTDGRVCVWFSYANAGAGQVVKAKFKHTDPLGTESTEEVEQPLKPGNGSAVAELSGLDGAPLAVGKYTVELTNQADVGFGPPLEFSVQ